jgi:hypothetical protein
MVRTMVRREYYGQLRSFFSEVSNYEGSRSKKKKKKGPGERTYFGSYEVPVASYATPL